jgi:hypothetical protein
VGPSVADHRLIRRLAPAAAVLAALLFLARPGPAAAGPVEDFERSWAHAALGFQYELGGDVALRNAPWVTTHNSFNSTAEMGQTLSTLDSNQRITILDQLRVDVRGLELDLHWFLSPGSGGFAPVVCHARGEEEGHAGCTIEKPLGQVLDSIAAWLRQNNDQVLLLYLEDDLGSQGHDRSAQILEQKLGPAIYRPARSGSECVPLPMDLTRDRVRAAGKQVLLVSGCGRGNAWPALVFDWSEREEERPFGFGDYPQCGADIDRATYNAKLVRYYEDSTQLTATAGTPDDGIPPETAARMARCGVDLVGLDQLVPDDGRLQALVWSWAPDHPRAGRRCAVQRRHDARWRALGCRAKRRAACRTTDAGWIVSRGRVRARRAARRCRRLGGVHAAPRTGYEAQLLRDAMQAGRAGSAWLGLRRRGGDWAALDER